MTGRGLCESIDPTDSFGVDAGTIGTMDGVYMRRRRWLVAVLRP